MPTALSPGPGHAPSQKENDQSISPQRTKAPEGNKDYKVVQNFLFLLELRIRAILNSAIQGPGSRKCLQR